MSTGISLFDMACLGVVLLSGLLGAWRGLFFEVLALLAWVGAFFAAQWGSVLLNTFWPWQWLADANSAQLRYLLSFVLVFVCALLLLGLCASAVRAGMKKTGLRPFDRVLGMGFGLLRAVVLLWAVTVLIWLTPLHQQTWWRTSWCAPWLHHSLRAISPLMPPKWQKGLPPGLRSHASRPSSCQSTADSLLLFL